MTCFIRSLIFGVNLSWFWRMFLTTAYFLSQFWQIQLFVRFILDTFFSILPYDPGTSHFHKRGSHSFFIEVAGKCTFSNFPKIYDWKIKLKMKLKILNKIAKISIFLCRVISIFVIQQNHLEKYTCSIFLNMNI